jgi:aspartyl-tRNA(Asn)/glutamyl-tRNA(Gln) amidotransferase subunit B
VEEKGITQSQRSKEYAHDYRYFPEPDLPPLLLSPSWVEEIRSHLPELPEGRRERFMEQYELPFYDANLLCGSKASADYFEACLNLERGSSLQRRAKTVLNLKDIEIDQSQISPAHLMELLDLIDQGTISGPTAKAVFEEMFYTGKRAGEIVTQKGLTQISDATALETVAKQVVANNAQAAADFRAGKQQALTFLVGQVMRATKGRANPKLVSEVLRQELGNDANLS